MAGNIYQNMNNLMDKWTEIIYTLFVKVMIPLGAIPVILILLYLHYEMEVDMDSLMKTKFLV